MTARKERRWRRTVEVAITVCHEWSGSLKRWRPAPRGDAGACDKNLTDSTGRTYANSGRMWQWSMAAGFRWRQLSQERRASYVGSADTGCNGVAASWRGNGSCRLPAFRNENRARWRCSIRRFRTLRCRTAACTKRSNSCRRWRRMSTLKCAGRFSRMPALSREAEYHAEAEERAAVASVAGPDAGGGGELLLAYVRWERAS